MASDYDKLKDMYRRQGQEEQNLKFREMVGSPATYNVPDESGVDGLQAMQSRLQEDRSRDAYQQSAHKYLYALDDETLANSRLAEAMGGDRFGVHGMPAEDAIALVKELHKRGLVTATTPALKQALAASTARHGDVVRTDSEANRRYGELRQSFDPDYQRVAPYRAGEEPQKK
jgi:hypothetical protein